MSRFAPKLINEHQTKIILESKLKHILSVSNPLQVYIFGSASRSEMTDHSDVDLALVFDEITALIAAREFVFIRQSSDPWPQDILLYLRSDFERKKKIGGVCQIIAEEGICIYERCKN